MSDRRESSPDDRLDRGEIDDPIDTEIADDLDEDIEDPGDTDDDAEAEEARDPGDDEGGPPERSRERPRSRGESRVQRLANEARDLRRRLEEVERGRSQPQQQADPYAGARAEQEFVASLELMSPSQAMIAVRDRERQIMGAALQQQQATLLDRQDRRDWEQSCRDNRTRARLAPQVEQMVADARRQGNFNLDRETAYKYALGDEIDRRGRAEAPRQRAAAQRRVASQTTRPGNGRGDAPRGNARRDQASEDERLLRSITIADL